MASTTAAPFVVEITAIPPFVGPGRRVPQPYQGGDGRSIFAHQGQGVTQSWTRGADRAKVASLIHTEEARQMGSGNGASGGNGTAALYDKLEDRYLARDQVGATGVFHE